MTELEQSGGLADLSRRGFLTGVLGAGAASAITAYEVFAIQPDPLTPGGQDPWELGPDAALTSASGGQVDVLERMRVELLGALEKPPGERRWVMVIDL